MKVYFKAASLSVVFLGLSAVGCDSGSTDPQGPEMGSVQQYLDEHPDEREDGEVTSEEDEFGAAELGS